MVAKDRWFDQLIGASRVLLGLVLAFVAFVIFQARTTDAVAGATLLVIAVVSIIGLAAGAVSLGLALHKVDQRGARKHALLLVIDYLLLLGVTYAVSTFVFRPMQRAEVKQYEAQYASQKDEIQRLTKEIPEPYRSMGSQMLQKMEADNVWRSKQGLPTIPLPNDVNEKFKRIAQLQTQVPPRGSEYILAAENDRKRRSNFTLPMVFGWLFSCITTLVVLKRRA